MTLLQRFRSATAIGICIAAAGVVGSTHAQKNFPSKPVRWVTVGAGSQNDLVARIVAPRLNEMWGQPLVIENRPGAGGAFAAATVAKALPDGYTLLMLSSQFSIGAAVHKNLPYDAARDFAGVTQIGFSTNTLIVSPSLGARTVEEFIALANSKPGQIIFSSAGAGSGSHMNGERFRLAAGIKATHVGFKSSPEATIEVVTARVHYCVCPLGPSLPFIKDGKLLALGVILPKRSPLLPDVPAMVEAIPGYQRDGSFGLLAPAGTPRPILNQISKDVARAFELPDVKEKLQAMGFITAPTTPEEFDRIVRADIETFRKVGRLVGLIVP
jgi:tripartite-type tricarboxylate transporter receptor subunit TctC